MTSSTIVTITVLGIAMVILLMVLGFIAHRIQRLKSQFAELVRTYLNLDPAVP